MSHQQFWKTHASIIFSFLIFFACSKEDKVAILLEEGLAGKEFPKKVLERTLEEHGYVVVDAPKAGTFIRLNLDSEEITDEGYQLSISDREIRVKGNDSNGLLYGIYHIKEQLEFGTSLKDITSHSTQANVPFRAIKFNLPWDSYRRSEALQLHHDTVRDLAFWEKFLDMMAENRFNVLTLWNLHPFNYLTRSTNYPEATGFSDSELEEWRQFWNALFRMAKQRGIETYLVNWNIFVSPEFAEAHGVAEYSIDGQYFSDGDTSSIIKDYTREVVQQVLEEYPDLTGLGISLGEGMGGMTPAEREEWVLETVIAGMQAADRPVKLIHRAPFSADLGSGGSTDKSTEVLTRAALDTLEGVEKPIYVEAKFNWSHAHSTPKLVKVHGGPLSDTYWNPVPENYKMTWMMRNEDFFALRWGQTDFIREHIERNTPEYVAGYYVGSECYIPAVDYFTRMEGERDWEYAFERQWLFYQTWGRLLYDPSTDDGVFISRFSQKYGEEKGESLFQAYQLASKVPLRLASLWDVAWDYTLYSEGFLSIDPDNVTNLITVEELINRKPTDPDFVSIKDYISRLAAGETFEDHELLPLQLADQLEDEANQALEWVEGIQGGANLSLTYEVGDVEIWSYLGLYLSEKIRGGVALATFWDNQDASYQEQALEHLEKGVDHWEKIIALTEPLYLEMPLVHNNRAQPKGRKFHWKNYLDEVKADLEIARSGVK
ncbi:glycoside hydrolase family 20 zincin-like fold domain-containing protein [Pleomorphovibrio marinus]|uniref:glycoside hydrolase family 20 zincin-like fold domain-containing protein n=1 Tax=Pleomorphovibrio marinus TaxID=2164132 RepID=UPI000E0A7576|nr:glycoside hydrolase family 20 zincin-like fold domain-containing protein [Pleomorphovibrio marinus]